MFLYTIFTKSVISASKIGPNQKIPKCAACWCTACACSCSAGACMLSLCSVVLGGSGVIFLQKFFTSSMISNENVKYQKRKSDLHLLILAASCGKVSISYFNSSQNRWDLARNAHNRKIQKMLVLARAQPVLAGAQPVPACSACARLQNSVFAGWHFPLYILHKIGDFWLELSNRNNSQNKIWCLEILDPNILEGIIFLHKLFTKSVIYGSRSLTSKNLEFG